ncbi:Stk1 family PASTA domain-containing Ser/Thr kinase [Paenibacillaceae bacterium]|nr:Stk1 family PASTA domain-containing Ser/Thr kinase [Paenibacillaceae bacterium]
MIGHELSGRYEIITRIGGGGMALVYKAHDILLNRYVAIKVLRQQFVHDEEFIRRFRREAQSAASLSHPNVVSIYDVGQEDETHYIVMEYVEGQNLNEIILERAPLQTDEAVGIAIQICDALEHAHHNQIIHRDIKPHNILIGKHGRVKVTDFGIARAVTSSTITQTGSVIGSVHYFSPEHAKGVSTGEKSDLYSLGIVLYQMLTGRLPFLGESPISVALKHLQESFEEPRVVNPHIPQSVENIIMRSMRKNPSERYESATEMVHDLETCLQPDRLNESKYVVDNDMEATRVMPAIRGSGERTRALAGDDTGTFGSYDAAKHPEESSAGKPGRKKWVKPLVTIGVTIASLALLIWGFLFFLDYIDMEEVDVPYVVGLTEQDARTMLEEHGLKVQEPPNREVNEEFEKGYVFQQTKQNTKVKQGALIQLYVSLGPKLERMEDYTGQRFTDVRQKLIDLGVEQDRIKQEEVHDQQEPGRILGQRPAPDEEFDPTKTEFVFTVSQGLETFAMPNLIGKSRDEAIRIIQDHELKLGPGGGIIDEGSYKTQGEVLDQSPYKPNDPVSKGMEVSITVSSGFPADAVEHIFNIEVFPTQSGGASEVRIVYSDATGENIEAARQTVSGGSQTFSVKAIIKPDSEARVTVYRDGTPVHTIYRAYNDAKSGSKTSQETVLGEEEPVPPPVEPENPPVEEFEPVFEETEGNQPGDNNGNGNGNGNGRGKGNGNGNNQSGNGFEQQSEGNAEGGNDGGDGNNEGGNG